MLKSCSSFSPNAFFKAAVERKFESVATAFCVNRMLNCERTGTPGKKNKQKKHCKKEKSKHAFSLSVGNSHMAAKLTRSSELSWWVCHVSSISVSHKSPGILSATTNPCRRLLHFGCFFLWQLAIDVPLHNSL